MSLVTAQLSISLDGYAAGPDQSLDNPLGVGGLRLHEWVFEARSWREPHGLDGGADGPDSDVIAKITENVGAVVMGRNMFSPGRGPWDLVWTGWWGDDPPFHVPVFVLTHHPREPLPMAGGTTFHFVTDGVEAALARARDAAGTRDVSVAGGASTVRQFLAAGLLDRLQLHIVPVTLGAGERLLDGVGQLELAPMEVVGSPAVTHITYRVVRADGVRRPSD